MFEHRHYVPVLKGKRAEFPALQHLKSTKGVTPLIEAVPSAPAEFVPKKMSKAWPADTPYFIDLVFFDDEEMEADEANGHALSKCFAEVVKKKQHAIPVTGIARSPAYQMALRDVASAHGYAIRLVPDDFEDEEEVAEAIDSLVKLVGVKRSEIDLIVDANTVAGDGASTIRQKHSANLEMVPTIDKWRTVTVVAGAFPKGLAPLTRDAWNTVARGDWHGWRRLVTGKLRPRRLPAFGDYAIAHPDLPPTGRATILAQLRYSTEDSFLVWKGNNVFKHAKKFKQFFDICADLIDRPEYRGADFSDGDQQISETAANRDSPGNAETWRRIGTNHHIETVMDQISNLPSA